MLLNKFLFLCLLQACCELSAAWHLDAPCLHVPFLVPSAADSLSPITSSSLHQVPYACLVNSVSPGT
eukprot:843828-Pelagomonas_calceolata.AAC.2